MNRNRLPRELDFYLRACEMDPHAMTDEEILTEARLVHEMHHEEGNCWNDEAKPSDKRTLARFIEREEAKLTCREIARRR